MLACLWQETTVGGVALLVGSSGAACCRIGMPLSSHRTCLVVCGCVLCCRGQTVVIVGASSSGIDLADDIASAGAKQ
jgi:hypothetical protein